MYVSGLETSKCCVVAYLILGTTKPFHKAPSSFFEGIRVTQICGNLIVAPRSNLVYFDTPSVPKAISQLEDGKDQLTLRIATCFGTRRQSC